MLIILNYHAILEDGGQALKSSEDPLYAITRSDFAEQMDCLTDVHAFARLRVGPLARLRVYGERSRTIVALDEIRHSTLARSRVVLTFDDGLKSHYDIVKPILEKHGFIGHFFITVGNIGRDGFMDWDELISLRKAGHIIGSHGLSHCILTVLKQESLAKELRNSRLMLSKMLGEPIDYFSVPGGFYNSTIRKAAQEAGYKVVLTSKLGLNKKGTSLDQLKRVAIRKDTPIEKFKMIIEQGRLPATDKLRYFSKKALQKLMGDKRYHRFREMALKNG